MTLAKATISGIVNREPQNRSTNNGVEVWELILNIDENAETLIRVISFRRAHADLLNGVKRGDKVLVDGRLQVGTAKNPDGTDKKYFEIVANDIELMNGSSATVSSVSSVTQQTAQPVQQSKPEEIVTFAETDFTEENLLNDEEVPF
jgi:single-stranded DNA-binding protein